MSAFTLKKLCCRAHKTRGSAARPARAFRARAEAQTQAQDPGSDARAGRTRPADGRYADFRRRGTPRRCGPPAAFLASSAVSTARGRKGLVLFHSIP